MFNKREIYEERISSLVTQILLICSKEQIPAFMTFAVEEKDKNTVYETEMLSAMMAERALSDDRIAKHADVSNGFNVIPPSMIPEEEFGYEEVVVTEDQADDEFLIL